MRRLLMRSAACAALAISAAGAASAAGTARPTAPAEAGQDAAAPAQDPGYGATAVATAQEFVDAAGQSGMMEVMSSEIATEQAEAEDVREFARMMIDDHTAANEQLMSIASDEGLTAPTMLDDRHQGMIDDIAAERETGEEFDRDYLDLQEEAHEEAVALFDAYAEDGENEALRTFASDTLPTLQAHLEQVRSLREGFDWGDDALGADLNAGIGGEEAADQGSAGE